MSTRDHNIFLEPRGYVQPYLPEIKTHKSQRCCPTPTWFWSSTGASTRQVNSPPRLQAAKQQLGQVWAISIQCGPGSMVARFEMHRRLGGATGRHRKPHQIQGILTSNDPVGENTLEKAPLFSHNKDKRRGNNVIAKGGKSVTNRQRAPPVTNYVIEEPLVETILRPRRKQLPRGEITCVYFFSIPCLSGAENNSLTLLLRCGCTS